MLVALLFTNIYASRYFDDNLYLENDQLCAERGFDDRDLIIRHEEVYTNRPSHVYPVYRGSHRDNYGDDGRRYNHMHEPTFNQQFRPYECGQKKCLFDDDNYFKNRYEPSFNPRGNNHTYNDGRMIENRGDRVHNDYAEPIRYDRDWNNNQRRNNNSDRDRNLNERPRRQDCSRCQT
ncbi:hypothetical protein COBT_002753, partial [Conglomerata obtusa]